HRRAVVASTAEEAAALLASRDPKRVLTRAEEVSDRPVVFLFAGGGAQDPDMGLGLDRTEPVFREQVDLCLRLLEPHVKADLRRYLFPTPEEREEAARLLERTSIALPVLFTVEYAQARLWMSWGVRPQAMLGHSLGEYVAACLAGVMSLEDALAMVALRGRLFDTLPEGGMLAVPLPEEEVLRLLDELGMELSIAAVNGPAFCVVSGLSETIAQAREAFEERGVDARRLRIAAAGHSSVVEPILREFGDFLATLSLSPPGIPYVSNVTGAWMTEADALDPSYWVRHLRQTVRFGDGAAVLLGEGERIFLEVGPGQTLSTLVMQHPDRTPGQTVLNSMRHPQDQQSDVGFVLQVLGKLWLAGAAVDWDGFYAGERRRKLRLPTYPFERQRYWVEPRRQAFEDLQRKAALRKRPDVGDWLYVPSWRQSSPPIPAEAPAASWLLLLDRHGLGERLAESLRGMGQQVTTAHVSDLPGEIPDCIVHLGCVDEGEDGFHSLLALARALADRGVTHPVRIEVVTTGVQSVTGTERIEPEKALVLGPVRVMPQEIENVSCRAIDVELSTPVDRLAADLLFSDPSPADVAWRGNRRWVQGFEPAKLPASNLASRLRPGGVYLITGGLGGVGLALAEHLARAANVRLVLVGRSPVREDRAARLQTLQDLGSEVLAASADVRDPEALRNVIAEARQRFGAPLSGVVHAAGIASGGLIQLKTPAAAEEVLSPKVAGTRALATVLADEPPLDFLVLCSWAGSVLGGLGRVDLCAASAFLDAFGIERGEQTATIAIDWDTWSEVGQAAESELPPDLEEVRRESLRHGMTTAEALDVFDRALASGLPRVVVSTRDLAGLLARRRAAASKEAAEAPRLAASHGRPALSTAFVAPESEIEKAVAGIWSEFLGIEGIGAHDNFFELGGHSLMATQITSRLRATFQADFTIARFFEDPTVAGLAAALAPQERVPEDDRLASLLDEVEGLSEEELDALLAAEEGERGELSDRL
ncbi:MAG TPA: SDR family NAD(P)-dependent oxidoreductase, partial [Thermoanaerobaculia bacterium]